MADQPETVLLHTVSASPAHDAAAERDAIEERLGIDVRLARTPPESREALATAEVALAGDFTEELLEAAPRLRWIQAVSSGVDAYPLDRLREEGIVLTNAAGIHAEPMAEQTLGYMLAFARRLHRGARQQFERRWERFEGGELLGDTLGIVGVGAAGSRIAELGAAFDMTVLGVKRDPASAPDVVDECVTPDRRFEVLAEADYLVIACPLTEETRGMIAGEEIAAMKDGAVLINIARGEIVDHDALVSALQHHVIRGAALDVYAEEPFPADSPLWGLSNVIMTPHMAGSTPRKAERIAEVVARNYEAFVAGDLDGMPTRVG